MFSIDRFFCLDLTPPFFFKAVLTNLEKINSLPMEMQTMSNRQTGFSSKIISSFYFYFFVDVLIHNGHENKNLTNTITPPPGMLSKAFSPQSRSAQHTVVSSTMPLMDQMKNLSVSSQPTSTTAYLGEYEVVDTSTQSLKKSTTNVASFPPRQNASLFTSATSKNEKPLTTSKPNGQYASSLLSNDAMKNDHLRFQSKSNINNKNDVIHNQQRDTPISNDGSIRFGNTSAPQTAPVTPSK
jgi:hypothetical protein